MMFGLFIFETVHPKFVNFTQCRPSTPQHKWKKNSSKRVFITIKHFIYTTAIIQVHVILLYLFIVLTQFFVYFYVLFVVFMVPFAESRRSFILVNTICLQRHAATVPNCSYCSLYTPSPSSLKTNKKIMFKSIFYQTFH